RSGILPPHAIVRALADLALPRTHFAEDVSVADLVSSRLGRGATERLIEPLLGGIHAGTADGLSLSEVAPQLARVMLGAAVGEGEFNDPNSLNKIEWRPSRSVILAARKLRAAYPQSSGSKSPIFLAPRGGVHRITSTLTEALRKRGTEIVTSAPVDSLQITDSGFKIQLRNGVTLSADSVIVATPAHVSARLLTSVSPELSRELLQIRYASVAVVTLLYPEGTIPREMNGTGFLSPRFERRLMTAATWLSSKWEHYLPDNGCLVRISVGRIGDERFANMSDADLSASVQSEFSEAMATLGIGIGQKIPQYSVTRWPLAIPQYEVGHRERIVKIRSLANLQGLFLAGAYLDGVGIPACIEVGVAAAKQSSQYICKR
ncbi:MAG TPA: protoporphyrinogen oxidase, partial [Acidimicrobiales bacterium]|nr:protoporphyrinogen oxidase [Acidimicrobiales bacterium]